MIYANLILGVLCDWGNATLHEFRDTIWVCLKIVYPYTQWLMIIIPTKWL